MIHERLNEKLHNLKDFTSNFKNLILLFQSKKDICRSFFDSQSDIKSVDILSNIDFEKSIEQIDDFKANLDKIEEMNNSEEQFSSGFVKLIVSEFVNVDFNQFPYLQKHCVDACVNFISDIQKQPIAFDPNNMRTTIAFLSAYTNYLAIFNAKSTSFEIFNKLKHIQNNIVMIGANGSGKSTFSRNLKSILSKQITVIPSQQLLFYKAPYSIVTGTDHIRSVYDYQHKDKLGHTDDIKTDTQDDFTNLILAIKKDEEIITKHYYETNIKEESKLLKIQRVWKRFINDKTIIFDSYQVKIKTSSSSPYSINSLSDGEKAIIYYSAHIFFAEENAYIIIDEPENHMHTALCDKLWNVLEQERPDCTFVYLTHNLDFAVSRNNKTILWNKSFTPPKTWDFEELPQDNDIPERLMTEIVGTRKNLLFCEGESKSSLDFRLYNILFDNFTVVPMRTRDDVIKSVLAYNANPMFHYKAIGIVDRDNYRDLSTLQNSGIYVLDTNEVENILCDEEFISKAITHFYTPNNYTVDTFKRDFFKIFNENIDSLSLQYATDFINDKIHSSFVSNRTDLETIKTEFSNICGINIDETYSTRKAYLQSLYDNQNYIEALSNCNLKKQLTRRLANKVIDRFEDRALEYISRTPEIKSMLINKYLSHIPQII